jgi:Protein of unknown function (DUF1552)
VNRRTILRGVAGSAIALPWLESFAGRTAMAASPPKRFAVHFHGAGTYRPQWKPTGTETQFTLPYILEPLIPFQKEIVVIDGLVLASGVDGKLVGGHGQGMAGMLTGHYATTGNMCGLGYGQGISLDQVVASKIGSTTKVRSLLLGADRESRNAGVFEAMSYSAPGKTIPTDADPFNVFKRLFSDFNTDTTALDNLREQRRSILDVVANSYAQMASQVSRDDKHKVDAHLTAIRGIENRLDALGNATAGCEKPNLGAPFDVSKQASFPQTIKLQMDLMVMALACDLTRVATLQCGDAVFDMRYPWLGIADDWIHNLTHAGDSDAASWQRVAKIKRWHEEQFAYLLSKMREVREGDGTLLDNTLVLNISELGKGNTHSAENVPIVLAGARALGLKTGRFLSFDPREKMLHSNLLLSILKLFDPTATTFGHAPWCSGPLRGL